VIEQIIATRARRLLRRMNLLLAHRVGSGMSAFPPLLGAERTRFAHSEFVGPDPISDMPLVGTIGLMTVDS
jgi:hypothetical protein